jgi:hypothetical protein
VSIKGVARSAAATILVGTVLAGGAVPTAAFEQERYCVTVRSDGPIEGDWIAAVVSGEATVLVEEAAACAVPTRTGEVSDDTMVDTASELLASLRVAPEASRGYDRDQFRHWVDADGDGCDARDEVLIEESLTTVTVGSRCRLNGGSWRSVYDGVETVDSSDFDVDHVVPLAEAWRSGAAGWDDERREAYANDLGDRRALRAVSASSNRSKSDQDPSEWLPPDSGFHCQYASDWVAIKARWDLAIDPAEQAAIEAVLTGCPGQKPTVVDAPDVTGSTLTPGDEPQATAKSTLAPPKKQLKPRGDCHPSYPGVCITPPPPDLDCGDIPQRRFKVKGSDPHRLDGDGDGVGCES